MEQIRQNPNIVIDIFNLVNLLLEKFPVQILFDKDKKNIFKKKKVSKQKSKIKKIVNSRRINNFRNIKIKSPGKKVVKNNYTTP